MKLRGDMQNLPQFWEKWELAALVDHCRGGLRTSWDSGSGHLSAEGRRQTRIAAEKRMQVYMLFA